MSLHVVFINSDSNIISDVTSGFSNVSIPANAFVMRIADDVKSYSNSMLTKLFEIDELYSKVLEYTTRGDFPYIDINVQNYNTNHTAIFNQLSAQFVGNNPPTDIYDFSGYGGSSGGNIDFSTIVTALNSIATALSALTNLSNLSNLADLANIITAINNKDNQSDIVDKLDSIFMYKQASGIKRNVFIGTPYGNSIPDNNASNWSIMGALNEIRHCFLTENTAINSVNSLNTKLFANLLALNGYNNDSTGQIPNNISLNITNSVFKQIRDKISNIETKLEQNLPFTTLAQVDVVTDYTQVVKGVGNNE